MSLRPVVFVRLALVSLLFLSTVASAEAQSCTAPTIVQVAGGYCAGEPVTLDAGPGWASYLWSNGQTSRYMTDAPVVDTSYTVTVTDGAGCEVTSAPFVHDVSGTTAAPTVSAPATMCTGAQGTATAQYPPDVEPSGMNRMEWTITGGHFHDPVGTNPTTASGESVVFVAAGPSPVTLNATAFTMGNCATGTATVQVTLGGETPAISAPAEVCPRGSGTASVAPPAEGGTWNYVTWQITNGHFGWDPSTGGQRTSTSGDSVMFYADNSGNPVELRVRTVDFQYCEAESSKTVAMRTIAAPVISAPTEVCPRGSGTASVAPPAEGGTWNYTSWQITNGHFGWDPSTGGQRTSTSGDSVMFYADNSGNPVELRVRTVDFQYCESESSKTVAMRAIAAPVISAPIEICPTGSATASVAPPAEGGSWNYISWQITNGHFGWDPNGQRTTANGESVMFYGDGSGTPIELRVRAVDFQYCESESSKTVAITPIRPEIQVTPQPVPLDGPATASVSGSFAYYSWQIERGWFVSGTSSSTATFQADGTGPVKLRVTVDTGSGCSGTSEAQFFVEGMPMVIDAPASFCSTSAPKTATLSTEGPAENIVWSVNNGTINAGQGTTQLSFTPSSLAVVTLSVEATLSGSPASATKVIPYAPPVIDVYTGDDIACAMRRARVEWRNAADFPSYTASVQNGVLSGSAPLFEVQANNDQDDVTMTITGTTADGCTATWTHTFQHAHMPELTYAPASLCSDGTQSATLVNASSDYLSFAWMGIENGTWVTPPPSSGAHPATISYRATGTSPVVLILRVQPRDLTCASDRRFTVPVAPAPAPPTIAASSTAICPGGSVTLTASPGASYLWSNGATTQSIAVTQPGDYTVSVTNAGGCAAMSAPTTISAAPPFTADIDTSVPTANLCENTPVTLTALPAGVSYLWSNGATTQSITVSTGGTYSVTVTNANGCSDSESRTLSYQPAPKPTITADGPLQFCDRITLTANLGPNVANWQWQMVNSADQGSRAGNTYTTSFSGTIELMVQYTNGCVVFSDPVTFTKVDGPSDVTIEGNAQLCPGGTRTLRAVGGDASTTFVWSTGATGREITISQGGTYSVTATGGPSNCSVVRSTTVGEYTRGPVQVTASGPTRFCQGGSVTLTANEANAQSHLWSNGATTPSITVTESGSYFVTVVDEMGCSISSTPISVTVDPAPDATITAEGPTTFCEGGSVALTAPDGYSYRWSNGATTQSITVNASGSYSVTVTNANGCSATSAATAVTVDPGVSAVITAADAICEGLTGTASVADAGAGAQYAWTIANGTIGSGNGTSAIVFAADGSAPVQLSVTVTRGTCAASGSKTVAVNPRPVFTIIASPANSYDLRDGDETSMMAEEEGSSSSATHEMCGVTRVSLRASVLDPSWSYVWSTGATGPILTVTANGSYTLTATNASGCVWSETADVVMKPLPAATISGASAFCPGGSTTLTAAGGDSYLWSTGATTPSITASTAGTYSVQVTKDGCSSTASTNVTEAAAAITADGPTTFCHGGSVMLTANPAQSYLWSNGATTQSITVTASGTYTVQETFDGCTLTSDPVSVSVGPASVSIALDDSSVCPGQSVHFTSSVTGGSSLTYQWLDGNGVALGSGTTLDLTPQQPGYGSVSLRVSDANGCEVTSQTVTYYRYTVPKPVITPLGPSTTFCESGNLTLESSPANSYLWSTGETTRYITVAASGSYTVTTTDGSGCAVTSDPITVTVVPRPPQPTITASGPLTFCEGGSVTLTGPEGYGQYAWSTGETTRSITVSTSRYVALTVVNEHGCDNTSDVQVVVHPAPVASIAATGPTTFCEGGSVTLSAPSGVSYAWSNGATTQSITVNASGAYSVTVTNANGCSATSAATSVTVNPKPAVPVIAASGPTALCPGSSVTLTAPDGYSYAWSNGATSQSITVSTAGSYSVTVTNANGCTTASAPVTVTNNEPTVITAQPQSATIARNTSRVLSVTASGTAPLEYQWYIGNSGDTTQPMAGQTSSSVTVGPFAKKGTNRYWVRVWSATCPSSSVNSATAVITVN